MKHSVIASLLAFVVLTSCGPAPIPTNSNAPTNMNVAAAPVSIPAGVLPLLQKAAAALEVGSVQMTATTLSWPVGEEAYRYSVPAQGGEFTMDFKGDSPFVQFVLMNALHMENGGVPITDGTTETSAMYDFPYVCLLRQPKDMMDDASFKLMNIEHRPSFPLTVSCGELDATAFKNSPTLVAETDALFADLTKELQAPHNEPTDIKFEWHDKAIFEKQILVQGREGFFPKLMPRQMDPVGKDLFEKLGFQKTVYSAEGTVTGAQGYQRGKLGCIVISSIRGWREELSKPPSTSTGESMPFYEKQRDGTSEMAVQCGAVE